MSMYVYTSIYIYAYIVYVIYFLVVKVASYGFRPQTLRTKKWTGGDLCIRAAGGAVDLTSLG